MGFVGEGLIETMVRMSWCAKINLSYLADATCTLLTGRPIKVIQPLVQATSLALFPTISSSLPLVQIVTRNNFIQSRPLVSHNTTLHIYHMSLETLSVGSGKMQNILVFIGMPFGFDP